MSVPLASLASRLTGLQAVSFPRTLGKLTTLMANGDTPTAVLAAILASDPVLGAAILGRANAIAAQPTGSLGNAVMVLGLGTVHGLVRSARELPEASRAVMAGCWSQANACGMLCRVIGRRVASLSDLDEEAWHSLGLIHDLGGIAARLCWPEEVARAEARLAAGDGPFSLMLTEELGASPGLLGSLWAHILNLPPRLITGLRYQEAPELARDDPLPAAALHVARNLVRGLGFTVGEDVYVDSLRPEALALLGLGSLELVEVLDEFLADMDELELFEGAFMHEAAGRDTVARLARIAVPAPGLPPRTPP
jgi:HD-like signal output (HDOD) protein